MNSKIELVNYFFRFIFEIIALISIGLWVWNKYENPTNYILAVSIPILFSVIWGVFNVPGDPSRSGKAPIKVPGIIRLLLELSFFGFAWWALYDVGYQTVAYALATLVIIHYFVSYERVKWLLDQK